MFLFRIVQTPSDVSILKHTQELLSICYRPSCGIYCFFLLISGNNSLVVSGFCEVSGKKVLLYLLWSNFCFRSRCKIHFPLLFYVCRQKNVFHLIYEIFCVQNFRKLNSKRHNDCNYSLLTLC